MDDLFDHAADGNANSPRSGRNGGAESAGRRDGSDYTADKIEVLEGLEPVRRRPGMYIGGNDESAMHHLVAEVLDNAMDEAVAGYATTITMHLAADGCVTIQDNGRGIPVDEHKSIPGKSALEVILTTLHSGGKFGGDAYETSGGLHGVGISVVNALSEWLLVEVAPVSEPAKKRRLYRQTYARGLPTSALEATGAAQRRQGTKVSFRADPEIFETSARMRPSRLYEMARSKAFLFRGVEIRWSCDENLPRGNGQSEVPASAVLHFPNGLCDHLMDLLSGRETITPKPFAETITVKNGTPGKVEWAISWSDDENGFLRSYCNTVRTPQGGTHESGLRQALARGLRAHGERTGNKRATQIAPDDIMTGATAMLSVFVREPQFQGQTKEKLTSPEATRLVEAAVRDRFELWLSGDPQTADAILESTIERAEERQRRKQSRDIPRKSATRKLRLPGKLYDCTQSDNTEIYLVEGDSAGGTAKQARNRETQAILPLRGKILNVASAPEDKIRANQELHDLAQALGCGIGRDFKIDSLRYERVIIMTDADVDGAHIAALLITYFYKKMPGLVAEGRLFLAQPPLYRLSIKADVVYARDDAHKDELMRTHFKGKPNVEISRFKGLGEMQPAQLRETTMDQSKRALLRVCLPDKLDHEEEPATVSVGRLVEDLMGKKPERRLAFIQSNARFANDLDV